MTTREAVLSALLLKLIRESDTFMDQNGIRYFTVDGRIYKELSPVRAEEIDYDAFLEELIQMRLILRILPD